MTLYKWNRYKRIWVEIPDKEEEENRERRQRQKHRWNTITLPKLQKYLEWKRKGMTDEEPKQT